MQLKHFGRTRNEDIFYNSYKSLVGKCTLIRQMIRQSERVIDSSFLQNF